MAGFVRLAMSSLLVSVPGRIRLKLLLALYRAINLLRRDHLLFHKAVRDHGCDRPMEEVQDTVLHSSKTDPQPITTNIAPAELNVESITSIGQLLRIIFFAREADVLACSKVVAHWQKASASCQETLTTGWSSSCGKPVFRHEYPAISPNLPSRLSRPDGCIYS